ncbi:hypothetical protein H5410_027401, partial [Solanum commersonii]
VMALECFSWITQLLCHRYDYDEELSFLRRLPDRLLIEILSRLPADCLVGVSKTLISSRNFSTLHLKRARPLLSLHYDHFGVLLFTVEYSPRTYAIFNPITQEKVIVQHKFDPGKFCAFYYCSLTRQLKLIYARGKDYRFQYSIYSVRAQTWKRKINCPTPNLLPNVSPAIVNGAVHLLVARDLEKLDIPPCIKGTMVLNMDKEEFSNMPHGKYIKRCLF